MDSKKFFKLSTKLCMKRPKKERTKLYKEEKKREICLSFYDLKYIFRNLNGRDLSNVAMVCRSWREAATHEKYLNREPYEFECDTGQIQVQKYFKKKEGDSKSVRQMTLLQSKTLLRDTRDAVSKSPIIPFIAFFLIPWGKSFIEYGTTEIYKLLPKNCESIMIYGYNEKAYDNKFSKSTCVLLPQIPNVKIRTVEITNKIPRKDVMEKYMQMIKGVCRQNHKTSTCLILLCNYNGYDMGSNMALRAYDDSRIASLWGGVVKSMRYSNRISNVVPNVVAVLITGSIQTWSVVVNGKRKMYEQIEEQLKLFKEQVKLRRHSLGFIFACSKCKRYFVIHVRTLLTIMFPELNNVLEIVSDNGNSFGKYTNREKKNVPDQLLRDDSMVRPLWTSNVPSISIMILTYN